MNIGTLVLGATISLNAQALAQEVGAIGYLDVDRLNANQVIVEFEYDGSACEAVGTAELGELVDGVLSVSFPTSSTAEICTYQLVEIEVEQAITVPEGTAHIEVNLLSPDGSVRATGNERIDRQ